MVKEKNEKKVKKLLTKVFKFGNIVIVNKDKDNGRKKIANKMLRKKTKGEYKKKKR